MTTRVVNIKHEECDVYIGRGSPLGNLFSVQTYGRLTAINMYHKHLLPALRANGEVTDEYLASLKGKKLGCHCKPQPCHGDLLVELINSI